jgi:hypothetical protein
MKTTTAISPIMKKVLSIAKIQPMAMKASQMARIAPRIVHIIRPIYPVCARRPPRAAVMVTGARARAWVAGGPGLPERRQDRAEHPLGGTDQRTGWRPPGMSPPGSQPGSLGGPVVAAVADRRDHCAAVLRLPARTAR